MSLEYGTGTLVTGQCKQKKQKLIFLSLLLAHDESDNIYIRFVIKYKYSESQNFY